MSMTSEEAIQILDSMKEPYCEEENEALNMAISALEEIQEYRAISTVSEFRELKEKATAKKAKWIFDDFTAKFGNPYRCSNCEEEFGDTYNYCPNCGCDMYAD